MNEPMNPFAAPQAEVADIHAGEAGLERASRWRRLGGAVIDGLLGTLGVVVFAGTMGLSAHDMGSASSLLTTLLMALAGVAGFLVIHGWLLVTRGQTVGKLILGTRIVHPDGSRVSGARLLGLRYGVPMLIYSVPVIGAILAIVNPLWIFGAERRCLHDLLANTIVIKI